MSTPKPFSIEAAMRSVFTGDPIELPPLDVPRGHVNGSILCDERVGRAIIDAARHDPNLGGCVLTPDDLPSILADQPPEET